MKTNIIKQLRIGKGMSQEDLAKILGVGRTTVCEYENGRINPPYEKLHILSKLFNVPIDQIVYDTSSPSSEYDVLVQLEVICNKLENDVPANWDGKPIDDSFRKLATSQIMNTIETLKYMHK